MCCPAAVPCAAHKDVDCTGGVVGRLCPSSRHRNERPRASPSKSIRRTDPNERRRPDEIHPQSTRGAVALLKPYSAHKSLMFANMIFFYVCEHDPGQHARAFGKGRGGTAASCGRSSGHARSCGGGSTHPSGRGAARGGRAARAYRGPVGRRGERGWGAASCAPMFADMKTFMFANVLLGVERSCLETKTFMFAK